VAPPARVALRLLFVFVSYLIAVLAGWLALVIGEWIKVNGLEAVLLLTSANAMEQVARIVLRFGLTTAIGFALIPCAIFIAAAEWFRLRSFLIYAYAGGLMGLWLQLRFTNAALNVWRDFDWYTWTDLGVRTAAGVVGGLVYWALAGRSAGKWRALPVTAAVR
jgi:hypothetical protein